MVAVGLTARLVAMAGNRLAVAATHQEARQEVVAIRPVARLPAATAHLATLRPAALHRAMARRSLVTAAIPVAQQVVPRALRRRRARRCSGSVSGVEGYCCSVWLAVSRAIFTCEAK
jgi:hypothetical protein